MLIIIIIIITERQQQLYKVANTVQTFTNYQNYSFEILTKIIVHVHRECLLIS